jgi:hypothetical protein
MNDNVLLMKMSLAALVVALLVTLTVEDGWLVWPPVLLAIFVTNQVWRALNR